MWRRAQEPRRHRRQRLRHLLRRTGAGLRRRLRRLAAALGRLSAAVQDAAAAATAHMQRLLHASAAIAAGSTRAVQASATRLSRRWRKADQPSAAALDQLTPADELLLQVVAEPSGSRLIRPPAATDEATAAAAAAMAGQPECCVCLVEPAAIALVPCGHVALCA